MLYNTMNITFNCNLSFMGTLEHGTTPVLCPIFNAYRPFECKIRIWLTSWILYLGHHNATQHMPNFHIKSLPSNGTRQDSDNTNLCTVRFPVLFHNMMRNMMPECWHTKTRQVTKSYSKSTWCIYLRPTVHQLTIGFSWQCFKLIKLV